MSLSPGMLLGPFEIVALLGQGGTGEVYRARDPRLARDVAIKVLHSAVTLDPDRRQRFEQEARTVGGLNDPNIVAVLDIGVHDGALYLVEELLEGATLRDKLTDGRLPVRKALDYAVQASRGLAAAHAKGIVHRDLKPENQFVTRDGRLKILDFGLAKLVAAKAAAVDATSAPTVELLTEPGMVLGTVGYMSPEQVRGRDVDPRSDLFSLGAVMFEMVAGQRAFQGESSVDTMSAILKEEPPELTKLNPDVPPGVERIIRRCLEKDPEERFHSARDLAFALESLAAPSTVSTSVHVAPPAARRQTGRGRMLAAGLALVALAAGTFLGRAFFGRKGEDLAAYRFTALATEQGIKDAPAWSPDGKSVAYAAQVEGVYQIFTRGQDQPVPAQLTHSTTDCRAPFWSPDNTRVFYFSPAGQALWEIGAAGGTPEVRLRGIRAAHLSPDGKTLAFVRHEANGLSLWVQPREGSQPRRLGPEFPGSDAYLRFAPNGEWLGLWSIFGEGKLAFWRVSYPKGQAERKLSALSNIRGPTITAFTWFPDSRHVVFSGALNKSGDDHLLLADTNTGSIRPITVGLAGEADPSLSPDGRRLVFTARTDDQDIVEIPLDGSPMRSVLATSTIEHCAAWSPQGDQFVYAKQHNGTDEIWIHSVHEGWERPLITAASFREGKTDRVTEPRYSPDGQRIAFTRVSEGVYSIWVASVAGGPPVPLGVDHELVPAWSPDGNWIAYTSIDVAGAGLFKVSSGGGGKPVAIVPGGGGSQIVRTQWSSRGDWLIWLGKRGLEVVSPEGSQRQLLSEETGWQEVQGFSKDGGTVFAIRENQAHHFLVEAFDIAAKRATLISDLGPQVQMHAFSLAPDGKSFLTTLSRRGGDIWILDGFGTP